MGSDPEARGREQEKGARGIWKGGCCFSKEPKSRLRVAPVLWGPIRLQVPEPGHLQRVSSLGAAALQGAGESGAGVGGGWPRASPVSKDDRLRVLAWLGSQLHGTCHARELAGTVTAGARLYFTICSNVRTGCAHTCFAGRAHVHASVLCTSAAQLPVNKRLSSHGSFILPLTPPRVSAALQAASQARKAMGRDLLTRGVTLKPHARAGVQSRAQVSCPEPRAGIRLLTRVQHMLQLCGSQEPQGLQAGQWQRRVIMGQKKGGL